MNTLARTAVSLVVVALAVVGSSAPAHADAAGDGVLAQMDAAANKAKTLVFEYDIVNQESGKSARTLAMKVMVKGEKRVSEFTAPADMKGTKVLVLSPTQMYVYLPAFGKVRRIASSVADQGFMGLAFSQDDLATTSFGLQYAAKIASEDATTWKLVLTPKAGQTTNYGKVEITLSKDKKLPSELKYFNAEGRNVKTEVRTGYTCEGDVCTPGERKMTDNTRPGAWTKLVAKSLRVNQSLSDDIFTQRSLGQ